MAVLSRQWATREFTRFIRDTQIEPPEELISQLTTLYVHQGDWEGVGEILGQFPIGVTDQGRTPPLALIDDEGNIVASNWLQPVGDPPLERALPNGWAVQVGGNTVRTLIVLGSRRPPPELMLERISPEGAATVERVRGTILVAGFIAGGLTLVFGGVLAWRLVRPLRQLTAAAEGVAQGDFSQRVPVTSNDEVGELAATFNYMAAELEQAEKLRTNMTADVAHELHTPLSVMRGKLEGVLDGVYLATPEHMQPVLEATELLTYLVEDLRLLAQAEAGQLTLEKQQVDVADLLQDAQVNFEPQASDRGVTLALSLTPELPRVMADWHRLSQVLGNLLTNALRHTPEGGCVTLSASQMDGQVEVTVADTGTGISAEDLPYVFERFWRGEKSRSRAGGGSGLGLAIAKQLVELHGGTVGEVLVHVAYRVRRADLSDFQVRQVFFASRERLTLPWHLPRQQADPSRVRARAFGATSPSRPCAPDGSAPVVRQKRSATPPAPPPTLLVEYAAPPRGHRSSAMTGSTA